MVGALEHLAFDVSVRALERQERVVAELRARTSALLTASALVASLLGTRALSRHDHGFVALAGTASAIASIGLSVYVLLPRREVEFTISGRVLFEHFTGSEASLNDVYRALVYWNANAWDANQEVIDRLTAWFVRACGLLVIAIVFWSVSLTLD